MVADNLNFEALRVLSTHISGRSGETVFAQLVEGLAKLLNTDIVFIGRIEGRVPETAHTSALWVKGKLVPNVTYPLEGTPCHTVFKKGYCSYPANVQALFPHDQPLVEWKAVSYAGVPLLNSTGDTIGILGVVDSKPNVEPEKVEHLIKLFAVRTSAEMERQMIESALKQSQANLSALIENIDDMIWSVDSAGFRLLTFNLALQEYVEAVYDVTLKPGMTPDEFLPPEIALLWSEFYRRAISQGSCRIAYRLDKNAGFVELVLNTILRGESIVGISVLAKDLTVSRHTEDELKRSRDDLEVMVRERTIELEEKNKRLAQEVAERKQADEATQRYEMMANSITDQISMVARDFTYSVVNDAFCSTFQKSRVELIGKTVREVRGAEFEADIRPCVDRCFSGEIGSIRKWIQVGVFGKRYCNVSMYPYRNASGPITHVIIMTRDITDEHEAENDLIVARRIAEEANQTKSLFLANMSHEIRTPMNAIIGMSHLLSQTQLNLKQSDYNSKIDSSAQNLLGIINDILDFSKVEAGKVELERVEFSLEDVLGKVIQAHILPAQEKAIAVELNIAEETPFCVVGDPLRLGQVLLNLTSNAIKFTQKGDIEIAVRVVKLDKANATLQFAVRDTGIGMSEQQISRLFVPFCQVNSTTTRQYGGTGLGLAISKALITMMGGTLVVESKLGEGSTFRFDLEFPLRLTVRRGESSSILPAVRRALVVDGNQISRMMLTNVLKQLSYDVIAQNSGEEALFEIKRVQNSSEPMFDVAIIDSELSGMDALKTARSMRSPLTVSKLPPLLLVMSKDTDVILEQAEAAGYHAIVSKPVNRTSLYNAIVQALARKSRSEDKIVVAHSAEAVLSGARILLVDDNEINLEIASELLRMAGGEVAVASSGAEALDILSRITAGQGFHAVLMDLQMPDMDGYETTRRIRMDTRFLKLPIIAMTADAVAGIKEKCFGAGMNDYMTKPINIAVLYSTLARWI